MKRHFLFEESTVTRASGHKVCNALANESVDVEYLLLFMIAV